MLFLNYERHADRRNKKTDKIVLLRTHDINKQQFQIVGGILLVVYQ